MHLKVRTPADRALNAGAVSTRHNGFMSRRLCLPTASVLPIIVMERRLRYVAVFWAALNQGNLLASIYASGGIGTKAQWRVEKLIRGCLHANERHVAAWCLAGTTQ
jgi:hypothetical protein